ncbi:MAG TPA: Flp pilus assembly protein CpaB [Firmicutes bacterium]|nr:Flp pilus assembly protein CpaB [Candidatus Fermentithermobacillaceae bacterium]
MRKSGLRFWAIVTVLVAVITGVLIYRYLLELQEASQTEPLIDVVAARVKIPQGTQITQEMVKTSQMPEKYVHPLAVKNRQDVLNRYAGVDILPEQMILAGHLITQDNVKELPYKIPDGLRAITIGVSPVSGVGGHIKPGHYVDVLVIYKQDSKSENPTVVTLLQNILVLAVGADLEKKEQVQPYDEVTLAVKPEDAQLIALGEGVGRIKLTLRPAGHLDKPSLPRVGIDALSRPSN